MANRRSDFETVGKLKMDYRFKYPGETIYRWLSTTAHMAGGDGVGPEKVAAVNIDITQRKSYEETIRFQLNHDSLTRLLNREGLRPELNRTLSKCEKAAVAFLDLDNFKNVNNTGGHEEGNRVLKQIAENLERNLPEDAVCARLSGDEFLVCFEYENIRQLEAEVARLLRKICPKDCTGKRVTASMGISLYPEHSNNESELMMMADKAMYKAKEAGKNRFSIHSWGS
jgi:diguanylate cyclase (GGDEF)-like protein